jgi:hypothetical protein
MRTWLVTVRNPDGKFIDQREIKNDSRDRAENDAYDWIREKGGDAFASTFEEIMNEQ